MGRKPRVDRSPEEKWQIVQEGLKSGNGRTDTGKRVGERPGEGDGRIRERSGA
jgi:hypothetical protein